MISFIAWCFRHTCDMMKHDVAIKLLKFLFKSVSRWRILYYNQNRFLWDAEDITSIGIYIVITAHCDAQLTHTYHFILPQSAPN